MNERKDYIFTNGDRVRMSALGAQRCPRIAGKTGVVVRTSAGGRYDSLGVLFDGNKTATALHRDYIELVPAKRKTGISAQAET